MGQSPPKKQTRDFGMCSPRSPDLPGAHTFPVATVIAPNPTLLPFLPSTCHFVPDSHSLRCKLAQHFLLWLYKGEASFLAQLLTPQL